MTFPIHFNIAGARYEENDYNEDTLARAETSMKKNAGAWDPEFLNKWKGTATAADMGFYARSGLNVPGRHFTAAERREAKKCGRRRFFKSTAADSIISTSASGGGSARQCITAYPWRHQCDYGRTRGWR